MLKRLKYVSRFAAEMTKAEIEELASKAAVKNAELEITGVLVTAGKLFFQILEGPAENVDALYETIRGDTRHTDVLLLSVEESVASRIYPDWSMRAFALDSTEEARLEPLRAVLETIVAARYQQETLVGVLQRGVWNAMVAK